MVQPATAREAWGLMGAVAGSHVVAGSPRRECASRRLAVLMAAMVLAFAAITDAQRT